MISQLLNRSLEIPLFLNRFRKRFGIPMYLRLKSTSFVQKRMRISPHPFFCLGPSGVEITPGSAVEKSFRMRLSEGKQILESKRLNEKEI